MTTTRHRIFVSFTQDEMSGIRDQAAQFRLSMSEMLRRFALGHRLPDPNQFAAAQSIHDLLRVNADLARLGNLLLLALNESDGRWPLETVAKINDLVTALRTDQDELKAAVKLIHQQIHPRAKKP